MARQIRADYSQLLLLPPSVEEWVPSDHPARFIRDFVDAMDMEQMGFKVPEASEGRPRYAADMLLKVWIYGYYSKIRSSRGIERACYDSMAMVWLTGNNAPDHNTLWRFWRDNKKALREVFRQSVGVAVKSEMVSLVLQAVDGTKIAAESSTAKAWRKDILQKKLAKLNAAIDEIMTETERNEAVETGTCRMPSEMADAVKRREKIAEALEELGKAERKMMHPNEPEAVVVPCPEGKKLGYNAQAVTESKNRIVVAAEVTDEANDMAQLNSMIESAASNTGAAGTVTVADAGYFTGDQLAKAEQSGHAVLVYAPADYKGDGSRFHRANFKYDAARDVFICPEGQSLSFWRSRPPERKQQEKTRVYRCTQCENCLRRPECTKVKMRTINKDGYYEIVSRQVLKQAEPKNKELLGQRKQIAELTFARLKQMMGFRRWTMRGMENVRAQWNMLCAALNLKIMYGIWREQKLKTA